MQRRIHNRIHLKQWRKELRNNSTSAEAVLWGYLKQNQLEGRKFRRQHSIGRYIVDFYCPEEKLIVELDGAGHFWKRGMQYDNTRTHFLHEKGFRVLRFENKWIFEDILYVLTEIRTHLMQ